MHVYCTREFPCMYIVHESFHACILYMRVSMHVYCTREFPCMYIVHESFRDQVEAQGDP